MSSRGEAETHQLQERLELQLDRLVKQLADLEEFKDDLDEAEYEESKAETLAQLTEFNSTLTKLIAGNMTLVDKFGSLQLRIQAAVSAAFQTPEVIRALIKQEPNLLRQRLSELELDMRLGKVHPNQGGKQKVEILKALLKLGEVLSPSEKQFMDTYTIGSSSNFVQVEESSGTCEQALAFAGSQLRSMNSK